MTPRIPAGKVVMNLYLFLPNISLSSFFSFFFFFLHPYLYFIIIFCKKSVHSLALTNTNATEPPPHAADDDDIHAADIDEVVVGGNFDGLTSCTDNGGYESSAELDDNEIRDSSWRLGRRKAAERRKSKKFPPPISSLSQDGKPTFFLRPMRKDGRLKLRQVRSNRPETALLASREDGRLRMHLIYSDDEDSPENSVQEDAIAGEEEEEGERICF